jgi:arylformamidase
LRVYDISLPLDPTLAEWPGDAPFRLDFTARLSEGASVNLSAVSMSVHAGSHADAPFHFQKAGASIDAVDLTAFIGPCAVVDVSGKDAITRADLDGLDLKATPRVLFKTGAWSDHSRFPETVPVMTGDLPGYLKDQGVLLVGLDVPSVDEIESKDLPIHQALGAAGIQILESLHLAGVPAGVYELIALPLRIVGADAAPVRAVLRG